MREIRTSGSTRGQWVADEPSLTVLLYRSNITIKELARRASVRYWEWDCLAKWIFRPEHAGAGLGYHV